MGITATLGASAFAAPAVLVNFQNGISFPIFTVVLSLCVVGLIVLALASILGSLRDDWKLKKREREPRPGDY